MTHRNYCTLIPLALLLFLLVLSHSQDDDQKIQNLSIMTSFSVHQPEDQYRYYQLTFNTTKKLLLLSINMQPKAYTNIFLSIKSQNSNEIYYTHPNQTHNTQQCDQSSLQTCIVRLDKYLNKKQPVEITVFFSVYSFYSIDYQLWASIDDMYSVDLKQQYQLDFSTYQSGLLRLKGKDLKGMEDQVMMMSYNTSGRVGMFQAEAAIDQIPNSQGCCDQLFFAQSIGAFNKILKIPPLDKKQNLYILITGQIGTKLDIKFYDDIPKLTINSSIVYYTDTNKTYVGYTQFQHTNLPLYIQLNSYSGYGVFNVNYCSGLLETTFQNMNGENQEIAVSSEERERCREKMGEEKSLGLLLEDITVDVVNVKYRFGFQIGVHEGDNKSPLRLNQQKYGTFLPEQTIRTYPIQILAQKQQISVRYIQLNQKSQPLLYQIKQCRRLKNNIKCASIIDNDQQTGGNLVFTPQPNHSYNFLVSIFDDPDPSTTANNFTIIQYILQLEYQYEVTTPLPPFTLFVHQIQQNQYNFYTINLTQVADQQGIVIVDNTELVITIRELNGDVSTLVSLAIADPTYDKYKDMNYTNQIIFSWDGRVQMLVNSTIEVIYISVRGNTQSLYDIHYTLDVQADIPAKYTKLSQSAQNNFMLNRSHSYQLFSFNSHIIPFKIYITNSPKCIMMGYTLPLNQTCLDQIPDSFTEKVVYFNVSNQNKRNFKFSVFVNSGDYILSQKNSVVIGCQEQCYEIVEVRLEKDGKAIHEGRGQIYAVDQEQKVVYNSFLELSCENYPCSRFINATLPYGGEMSLFLQASGIKEIQWSSVPITFGDYPKKYFYTLRPWVQFNSILIFSQALQLDIYYNVVNLRQNEVNVKSYSFPTPSKHDRNHSGNPLRKVSIVTIDDQLLQSKGCHNYQNYCILALSLYPNLKAQYSLQYFSRGIGYISANTYQIQLNLNDDYDMWQKYTMSYFTHRRSKDEIFSEEGYRIHIQPLSNCHPKLYTHRTLAHPSYNDAIVHYNYGWINFTVLAEKECKYKVSLTNSLFLLVGANTFYRLNTTNGNTTVLFRNYDPYRQGFRIQISTQDGDNVDAILANQVASDSAIIPASQNKHDHKSTSNILDVPVNEEQRFQLFVITILAKSPEIQLLVSHPSQPIVITRNHEQKTTLQSNSLLKYKISTTGSVALFLTSSSQYVTVTINKNFNRTLVKKTIMNKQSYPWLYINSTNTDLVNYDVTILNQQPASTDVTFMFQENDPMNYLRLYPGIATYDAFTLPNQTNCYYFETPLLVGAKRIAIDFVISHNNSYQINGHCNTFKLEYTAITDNDIVKSFMQKLHSQPLSYRLYLQFMPKQNYTICYNTANPEALNLEYYILLNDMEMEHLVQDKATIQYMQNGYDMYQIIEEGFHQKLMIEVTSCVPTDDMEKVLVGSNSFIDAEMGRYTDLVDYHKTKNSIFAQLDVSQGYYYLGVKNQLYDTSFKNSYSIRYQNITSETMLAPMWELQDTNIVKIYSQVKDDSNQTSYTIQLPEVVSTNDEIHQQNIKITYKIAVLEVGNNGNSSHDGVDSKVDVIPLDMTVRCPNYFIKDFNVKVDSRIKIYTASYNYDNLTQFDDTRKVPTFILSQLPKQFNITGKIDVQTNTQQFSFYYDNSQMKLEDLHKSGISVLVIFIIIIVTLSLIMVVAFVVYKFIMFKKRFNKERKDNQEIDMTDFHSGKKNPAPVQLQPKGKDVEKGYGQLVDQIN